MTYNTNNPVGTSGSSDPRDMYDNAENLDLVMTSDQPTFKDRLNRTRPTLKGFEIEHQAGLDAIIMVSAGDFFSGTVVTARNQTVLWSTANGGNGHEYRWAGELNKTVPPESTPSLTGGVYPEGMWIDVGVTQLRSDITQRYSLKNLKKIAGVTQSVSFFYSNGTGIGGNFIFDPTMSASFHDGGSILAASAVESWNGTKANLSALSTDGSGYGCYVRQDANKSVEVFGALGIDDDTQSFSRAAISAENKGHRVIDIPFPAFQVTDGTNGRKCTIYGAQTVLTGRINNHAGFHDVIVNGKNQSDKQVSPVPATDHKPKILWKESATFDYVIQQKKSRGYMLAGFVVDNTTSTDSLATGTSNPTRRRLSRVLDAVWAGLYKFNPSSLTGTGWVQEVMSAGTLFANMIPANNSGRPLKRHSTSKAGESISFQVKPKNGQVTIAVFSGPTSCESATVSINGVNVATISVVASAINTIKIFTIPVSGFSEDQSITLRITHAGSEGKALGIIGVNFYELKDWNGAECDAFSYYRHTVNFAEYLTTPSANDVVIQEFNSQIYGLSYHGGETSIVNKWFVDNLVQNPALDNFVVGRQIELSTSANASWAGVGGGSVNINSKWEFGLGSVSHTARLRGYDIEVRELYAHMFGTNESFSEVIYPSFIDLSAVENNSRNNVGRTSKIVLRNPATGQTYSGETTLYEREQNRYGGVHVWRQAGQYNKVYYGPVLGGRMALEDFSCISVHTFE